MPAPLDVDRDQVKMLALELGMAEASRRTGIPDGTIRQWANRGHWFDPVPIPVTKQKQPVTGVTKPADVLAQVISENKLATRSGLAQFTADAATKLAKSKGNLKNTRPAKDIADIMSKVWTEGGASTTFNLALLCNQAAIQVVSGTDTVP